MYQARQSKGNREEVVVGGRLGLRLGLRQGLGLTSAYINMAEWQTLHESSPRQLFPVEPEVVRKEIFDEKKAEQKEGRVRKRGR